MARFEPEMIITQSLLDRLTDDEPGTPTDPQVTQAQSFRSFKGSLRRDLEWLLNTRRIAVPAPEALHELCRSLFHYGLPDVMSLSAQSSQDRNVVEDSLRMAVECFEPRLKDVRVTTESAAPTSRMMRFRIEGLARIDPAPELVTFDTVLELTSGQYEVK